jgi:hypothetical protein
MSKKPKRQLFSASRKSAKSNESEKATKLLPSVLAVMLTIALLPLGVFSDIKQAFAAGSGNITVTVAAVDNNTNKFVMLPTEITVSAGTAAQYGYENAAQGTMVGGVDHGMTEDQISPLDALVAAHEYRYGTGFTPSTYIGGTSSYLTRMFGLSSGTITYSIDGLPPVGQYSDAYGINEYALSDGDFIVFAKTSDENWGMDCASFFTERSINVTVGEQAVLTLLGYDPMEALIANPGTPTIPLTLSVVVGADIMYVDPATGNLSMAGAVTDQYGKATLSFNQPGVYHLSAIGETYSSTWYDDVTCGLAYCKVTVTESSPTQIPMLEDLTITNLDTAGLNFDPATFDYHVTTATSATSSITITASFDDSLYSLTVNENLAYGSGYAWSYSLNPGINSISLCLQNKLDLSTSYYTISILRARVATLAALSLDTVNQPLINGREGGTLWKAGATATQLGTRSFVAATKDYRAFFLSEIPSTSIAEARPTLANSWLRLSIDGTVVLTGQSFDGYSVALTNPATTVLIEVCTDATYQENQGFIPEDSYTVSIEILPLNAADIENLKLQSLEVSGGELLTPFSPDNAGLSMYVRAEEGATVTYTATADAGTVVYRHLTSTSAGNVITPVNGVYTHSDTATQPYIPNLLLGYQTAISTSKDINLGGLVLPVRYQYKFLYNTAGNLEGGASEVVDYIVPDSQYANHPAYGMNPDRLLAGGLISLGNFGGYVTVKFDTPIQNNPNNLYGVDLKINGNSHGGQGFSEPGNVWVSKDGMNWYLLAGSDYFDDNTIRDYEVTYTRNADGTSSYTDNYGSLIIRNPETGLYRYPLPVSYPLFNWQSGQEDQMTFAGPLLTSNASDPYGSASAAFPNWGYVDVRDGDTTRTPVNPYLGPTVAGTGSSYDISWAIDADGKPVYLDEISYLRVSTASHIYAGAIGEKSTEVSMIVSVAPGQAAVGVTAAPSAIVVNGVALDLTASELNYKPEADGSVSVAVTANSATNVYINNAYGANRTYASAPASGVIRVIVQQGNLEPLIYYLTQESEDPGTGEPSLVDGYYQLRNSDDLLWFAELVNSGETAAKAQMINDIALDTSEQWLPIGPSSARAFQGVFDGQGHTLSGLTITISNGAGTSADSYKGLFAYIGVNGTVRNLCISNSTVSNLNTNANYAAYLGLVAGSNAGSITSVIVDNSAVVGKQNIGGIAGQNSGSVVACANLGATVTQTTTNDNAIAGIVGQNSGLVQYCYNNAAVLSQHGSDYDGYFAGIVGNNASAGRVDSCYNTAEIVRGYRSAGIVAVNSGLVSNSYNTGTVNANGRTSSSYGGGVCAYGGTVNNSFYLEGCVGGQVSSFGIALAAVELKASAATLGGAYENDLPQNINSGYPILKWQNPAAQFGITLTANPVTAVVVLTSAQGELVSPYSVVDGVYRFEGLLAGRYDYTVSADAGDYLPQLGSVSVSYANLSLTVLLQRRLYEAQFIVSPDGSNVSVIGEGLDFSGTVVEGLAGFSLPIGFYTYTVAKFGYVMSFGDFLVLPGVGVMPVQVNLQPASSQQVTFDISLPAGVDNYYRVGDPLITVRFGDESVSFINGMAAALPEGIGYSYSIEAFRFATIVGSFNLSGEALTISRELEELTGWDGVTRLEPMLVDGVYQISNGYELAWFANAVNSGLVFASGSSARSSYLNAVLVTDIDLCGFDWVPIGTYGQVSYSVVCGYAGNFDGNGYAIRGLNVASVSLTGGAGLFGTLFTGAQVHDLTVYGSVSSGQYCGGIAAYTSGAVIVRCESHVDVVVAPRSSGRSFSGGITGYMTDPNYYLTRTSVESCTNYGLIDGCGDVNSYVGGIVGTASYGIGVNNCANYGTVIGCDRVGGIAGDGSLPITGCYNSGTVEATFGAQVGGIAGFSNKLTLDCYNTGDITSAGMAGGIVGNLHSGYGGMISNCYNTGCVVTTGSGSSSVAGAIAGYKGDPGTTIGAVVANCYWLEGSAATGIGFNAHSEDATLAMSASDMKQAAFVNLLGAAFKLAASGYNSGYPLLNWQDAPAGPSVGAPGSGDLNGDGFVTADEALTVAQIVVGGGIVLTPEQFAAMDMDGDGRLTMADVMLIMRKAAE